MIFSDFRDSVAEIVASLVPYEPNIRAAAFIGQASTASAKGLTQKEQEQIISQFKSGVYNVLVATCIGEEGLGMVSETLLLILVIDIGEVDLIVCFDAQSSPIRMIQRMGRTGRKRQGKCIILATEESEVCAPLPTLIFFFF